MVTSFNNFKRVTDTGTSGEYPTQGYYNSALNFKLNSVHGARINQLRMMQNASLTEQGNTPTDTKRDIMSDNTGYNNLIDTGNTDAYYNTTNKCYVPKPGSSTYSEYSEQPSGSSGHSNMDITITTTSSLVGYGIISAVGWYSEGGTTTVSIMSGATTLASKSTTDTGGVRTFFSVSDYSDYLKASSTYHVVITNNLNQLLQYSQTTSYAGSRFTYTNQRTSANGPNIAIQLTELGFAESKVQTIDLAGSGNNINSIIVCTQNANDGSNLITYDVSSDNGSNWTTGLSFEQLNNITSALGHHLIVRFQLPGDADAKLYGFSTQWSRV